MKEFLRDYWLWMAIPFVLILIALLCALFLVDDEGPGRFVYGH